MPKHTFIEKMLHNYESDRWRSSLITAELSSISGSEPGEYAQAVARLKKERDEINARIKVLEFCVEQLRGIQRDVIQDIYIHRLTWCAIREKYEVSHSALGRYRRRALEQIEQTYCEITG